MPRTRQITPFGVRMTVMLTVVASLIAGFAAFVIDQQHAADRRRAATLATEQVERDAQAQAVAAEGLAVDDGPLASSGQVAGLLNGQARDAAGRALAIAAEVAAGSSYDAARPAALAAHDQSLLYVDGPSTAPSVVSVYNGAAGWAAAVHGANGTCFWVAVTSAGLTRYGSGSVCTGMAALAADLPAW